MISRAPRAAAIDGAAISLSGLCLIHCLALPILSATLPLAGVWAEAEWLHKTFVVAALPFSLLALTSARTPIICSLIALGFMSLALGAFVEALHDFEVFLTVAGGIMLATGHAMHWIRAYNRSHS